MSTTRKQWCTFLEDVADRVDELILEEENLRIFRKNIYPFAEQWKKWWAALEDEKNTWESREQQDWQRAETDERFRRRHIRPDGENWDWDGTCGLELVGRDDSRYWKMPACFGDKYIAYLLERVAQARRKAMELSPTNPRKRICAEGAKAWMQFEREVKTELAREAQNPTGDLFLTHPWFTYYPHRDEIGNRFGCWRQQPQKPDNIIDVWFPVDARSPGRLPSIDPPAERQRWYVTLACIHDNRLPYPKIATENIWPLRMVPYTWTRVDVHHDDAYGPRETFIRSALHHVANELSKKSPVGFLAEAEDRPFYVEINLAERKLTVGEKIESVTSNQIWDFLKALCDAHRHESQGPNRSNKAYQNANDMLRKIVGKMMGADNRIRAHKSIVVAKGNYYTLRDDVKITGGSQKSIRPTKTASP